MSSNFQHWLPTNTETIVRAHAHWCPVPLAVFQGWGLNSWGSASHPKCWGRLFPPSLLGGSPWRLYLGKLKKPPVKSPSSYRRVVRGCPPRREGLPFYTACFARRLMPTLAPVMTPSSSSPLLTWILTVSSFYSPPPASSQARKCQRWAIKSFKTIFMVEFYWAEKQYLCHLDISEKT